MEKINFHFFALAALGSGLSGSDRIFIEFARRWSRSLKINIYLWTEGYEMCQRQGLKSKNILFKTSSMRPWNSWGFIVNYFARIFEGIRLGFVVRLRNNKNTLIYSASDFWMDVLPCFILKLRFSKVRWMATWYQTAPNPIKGYSEGQRVEKYRFKAFLYWLSQLFVKPLISNFANFVLVNNESEKRHFPSLNKDKKVLVVLGAVDTVKIHKWILKNKKTTKIYDAVFQGRFHPQKGSIELVEIWRIVVDQKSDAKLVMIGDGPLMEEVKLKIKSLRLENNIKLLGYVFDGPKKYKIFLQSNIVVHPAFYDSGGMASAEAMAFGLPCVGFNLKAYQSYYPKGMIKVPIGNLDLFAKAIIYLLKDDKRRKEIGLDARKMIEENWSWDRRVENLLNHV